MKVELVFIPLPGAGHLTSAVEVANHLVARNNRVSITFLMMKPPNDHSKPSHLIQSDRIRFIHLPPYKQPDPDQIKPTSFMKALIEYQKPIVRQSVINLILNNPSSNPPRLAGFVIDMFCTPMIDVANELGVPTYMFFTSSAAYLSLEFHVQFLQDHQNQDVTELKDSEAELTLPGLKNPIPLNVLPSVMLNKEWIDLIYDQVRRFRETKGIMINTFKELESDAINSLSQGRNPPIYPIGPLLDLKNNKPDDDDDDDETSDYSIVKWLDDQPPSSVVFLCFGSMGSFNEDQVKEIANALEKSGHRFVWSLRKPPPIGTLSSSTDYTDLKDVLPEGFLDRTSRTGKVIGWAPQVTILAHPATGGFVSHCGWNSTLESLWHGVPMAVWPLYAEQHLNAFAMVVELGLAVEIKMDYRNDFIFPSSEIVRSEVIEKGIRCLMNPENQIRAKLEQISRDSKTALMDGGSSQIVLDRYIQHVFDNMQVSI